MVDDEFLGRLHDSVLAGRALHEGCAPLPVFAELDEEARVEAAAALLPVVRATLRLLVELPVGGELGNALSAEWTRRRVGAFMRERLGDEGAA